MTARSYCRVPVFGLLPASGLPGCSVRVCLLIRAAAYEVLAALVVSLRAELAETRAELDRARLGSNECAPGCWWMSQGG